MPAWNENHYARATEFIRLLAGTVASSAAAPAASVAPTAPAAAPAAPPKPAAPTPPPAAPPSTSAASVFKKIPWKK